MPIYEYECQKCGKKMTALLTVKECFKTLYCADCNTVLKKIFSTVSIKITPPNFFESDWYKEHSQHKPKPNRMLEKIKNEPVNLTEI